MKKTLFSFYIALLPLVISYGQVFNGTDSLFLNEWISFDQDYIKFELAENGMYKVDGAMLQSLNFPSNGVSGENLSLFYRGNEIPLHVSTLSNFSEDDFFIFHGQKNDGEIDKYLYEDPDEMQLNPAYSLFNDTSAYYLSWNEETNNQRFEFVENDISGTLPAAETYYLHTEEKVFSNGLVKPTYIGSDNIRYSHFDKTEGFGSSSIPNHSITLTANNIALDGPNANLHVRFATNNTDHLIQANWNNEEISFFDIFGLAIIDTSYAFQSSSLVGNNVLALNGTASSSDRISVAFAQLKYPRSFDFNNQDKFFFELEASSDPMYLEIQNFSGNNDEVLFYDLTNQIWMEAFFDENDQRLKLLLPPSALKRNCILVNTASGISNVINSKEVTFIDYSQESYNYVIISNDRLLKDVQGNNENWSQAYADYRNSNAGGNFNTIVVTIDQLYDQFAYGIQFNPLSIKNFTHFIKKYWDNPEYIFIIGKGREYGSFRNANQQAQQWESTFIPTFGLPGGDNLLASAWGSAKPVIPIGRYAAKTPREIQYYLNKVIAHEENVNLGQTIEERQWMKNVLHLSGGSTDIQASIQNYLKNMENVIEDDVFGGHVTTFTKTSSDPIQVTVSDQIFKQINDGLSILTFFGHSAVGTFDFSIENIANYENYGKTFLSFSLGCHSGNIHTNTFGISEEFVVQDGVGAIAFIATSGIAYVSTQYNYAKEYYTYIGKDHYGESIGKASQDVIEIFDNSQSLGTKTFLQQITLHGDPAIRINTQKGPDYIPDYASVQTDPKVVDVYLDSFDVHFDVVNIGQSIPDSFHILVQHIYPDGTEGPQVELYEPSPKYADSYTVSIPIVGENIIGKNLIHITVDSKDLIAELPDADAENNNELRNNAGQKGYPFYVLDNSAVPVGPKEFSIVSESPITLYASTYNTLGEKNDFLMEIDTTESYNSSIKQSTKINQASGIVKWTPDITFTEGQVYYWRISPDSTDSEIGFVWKTSSFIYLPNSSPGWNQSDYFQYLKGDFDKLEVDLDNDFSFTTNLNDYHITNKVWEPGNPPIVFVNGSYCKDCLWFPFSPSIVVVVIDDDGNFVTIPPDGEYGGVNHWDVPTYGRYYYINEDTTRHALMDFLENHVENNHQVMLYTVLANANADLEIDEWANDSLVYGKNLFQVLEEHGATRVRELETKGNVPYIFAYRNGAEVIDEQIAEDNEEIIESIVPYLGHWFEGSMKSPMIGPASEWDKVVWDYGLEFDVENDSIFISVIGIDSIGDMIPLIVNESNQEIDLSQIDADKYPKLILSFYTKDETNQSSADLGFWRVLYEGIPEAALNAESSFSFYADTLQQGDQLRVKLFAHNISKYDMDSLLVRYSLTDEANQSIIIEERIAPLLQGDSLILELNYNTKSLFGLYQFYIEINPDKDQEECFYLNNTALAYFNVIGDKHNPVLDVTFDGVHIIDGDIVSPKPNIQIILNDENEYLLLQDTSLIQVLLKYPNGTFKNIPFSDPSITFFTAEQEKNEAKVEFKPELEVEGFYELQILSKDVSGNISGDQNYIVSFQVILDELISNVLNYPNPFSTSTQFIFTLTGEEIPEYLKIQIMTASGKVVKEITKDELGPLKIGLNRTSYWWNGTDDYGSLLGNGVYFYRIVSKNMFGENYDKLDTNTDEFFEQNLGKMVILR